MLFNVKKSPGWLGLNDEAELKTLLRSNHFFTSSSCCFNSPKLPPKVHLFVILPQFQLLFKQVLVNSYVSNRLNVFMQSSIFWFDITNVFITEQITFYWFPASAVASAVVDKEIKMLLTNGISIFLASGKLISSNGSKSLPWNWTDQTVLSIYVFWYFFFRRGIIFKRFKCRSLNNNLCEKLVLSSPIIYDENLQVTFFTFLLLTLGLDFDKLTFILLYCVIYDIYLQEIREYLDKI